MKKYKLTVKDILKTYNPLFIVINGKYDCSKHKEHFDDLSEEILNTTSFQYGYYAPSKMFITIQ